MAYADEPEYPKKLTRLAPIGAPPNVVYPSGTVVKVSSIILTNPTGTARTVDILHGDGVTLYYSVYVPDGGTPAPPGLEPGTVEIDIGHELADGLAIGGSVVNSLEAVILEFIA